MGQPKTGDGRSRERKLRVILASPPTAPDTTYAFGPLEGDVEPFECTVRLEEAGWTVHRDTELNNWQSPLGLAEETD